MKRFALVLAACLLPGCGDTPVSADGIEPVFAAAETETTSMSFPIDIGVFVECAAGGAGELVQLSGNLHSLTSTTVNANGFTSTFHNQPQGITGTGLTTGDRYQGTGVTRETVTGSFVNGQFSDTYVNNYRIIGAGTDNNFTVHAVFHVTFNANGDLTALVDIDRADCS